MTDVALLTAALLHDAVEDTQTSYEDIAAQFGVEVRELVAEMTDDKSLPKSRRKQLQIENAPHKTERAKQLKIADKLCNIRDIDVDSPAAWSRDRKVAYLDWAAQVVDGCRGANPTLEQLFDAEILVAIMRVEGST